MSTIKSSSEDLTLNADGAGNDVVIQNNGTETVRVDSSGNVGIGTSSPDAKLQVVGSSNTDVALLGTEGTRLTINTDDAIGEVKFKVEDPSGNNYTKFMTFHTEGGSGVTERMRIDSSGNLKFNSGYGSVATAYGCRAWIKFNGAGTILIYNSANVSSIVDLAVGRYSVNFTTAMVDADYAAVATNSNKDGGCYLPSTTGVNVFVGQAAADSSIISVAIFR